MNARWSATVGCLVGALALGVGACGGDDDGGGGGEGGGKTLTIYSSMPLQGASGPQTKAIVNGMSSRSSRPATRRASTRSSSCRSTTRPRRRAHGRRRQRRRTPARPRRTTRPAVYLGEFNSGAAAISIPLLNEAAVPQISPANTAVGLTVDEPGATAGEPDKYYPTGQRTYARIVARDSIKGPALVSVMKEDGCTKVQLTNDKEVYGAGLAEAIEAAAGDCELEIIANDAIDKNSPNYRALAQSAAAAGADCFVFSGITANNAVQLYKDFAAAIPDAKLYGLDGVCESGFIDPKEGGIPASVASRFKCQSPTLPASELPPKAQDFFTDVRRQVRRQDSRSVLDLRL